MRILKGFEVITEVPEGYKEIRFIGDNGDMVAVSEDKPPIMFNRKANQWEEIKPLKADRIPVFRVTRKVSD